MMLRNLLVNNLFSLGLFLQVLTHDIPIYIQTDQFRKLIENITTSENIYETILSIDIIGNCILVVCRAWRDYLYENNKNGRTTNKLAYTNVNVSNDSESSIYHSSLMEAYDQFINLCAIRRRNEDGVLNRKRSGGSRLFLIESDKIKDKIECGIINRGQRQISIAIKLPYLLDHYRSDFLIKSNSSINNSIDIRNRFLSNVHLGMSIEIRNGSPGELLSQWNEFDYLLDAHIEKNCTIIKTNSGIYFNFFSK